MAVTISNAVALFVTTLIRIAGDYGMTTNVSEFVS
jgi:hypothetical protein